MTFSNMVNGPQGGKHYIQVGFIAHNVQGEPELSLTVVRSGVGVRSQISQRIFLWDIKTSRGVLKGDVQFVDS